MANDRPLINTLYPKAAEWNKRSSHLEHNSCVNKGIAFPAISGVCVSSYFLACSRRSTAPVDRHSVADPEEAKARVP
jgi:hypothetical protein